MIRKGEIDVDAVRKQLLDRYDDAEIQAITNLYAQAYGDSGLTAEEVLEEILCDSMGKMNAFATESTRSLAGEVGVFLRNVRKSVRKQEGGQKKSATGDGGVKYSVNPQFYDTFDKWDGKTIGFSFVVGNTSKALVEAGIPQKQIRWDASKIAKLLEKHNGMTRDVVRKIPELLENPVIVIDSKQNKNARIIMGDLLDDNGKTITAVLLLTPTSKKGNLLDFYKVSSAEGRSHIKSLFYKEDGTLVTVRYTDKNRVQSWLNVNRLQLPLHNLDLDPATSIGKDTTKVKAKFSRELDSEGTTLSPGQIEFFKDSKIRDEDGNLRVVYHGTDQEFTVFDRTKARANMDIQGSFFSPWDIDAGGYGGNVKAYYLNITNPAPEGTVYRALNRFKGQNGAGVKAREYLESLGYDGVNNGDEEYIAFYPEQIKLVSNQNPSENPDTRYSREMDPVVALEKQVKLLRKQKEYWKSQTKRTDGKKADSKEVRKLVLQLHPNKKVETA